MRYRQILFFIILTLFGCRNYNSENYINTENEAIKEIIPQITDFKSMSTMNNKDIDSLKLYLISILGTKVSEIHQPSEKYVIAIDGVDLSESEILENKTQNLEEIEKAKNEKQIFTKLTDGTIRERTLNYQPECQGLQIELIDIGIGNNNLRENELGYLYLSRVIFNRDLNKGYLSYSFYCGSACAWANNIEITMVNGKWKVTKAFSGWIA